VKATISTKKELYGQDKTIIHHRDRKRAKERTPIGGKGIVRRDLALFDDEDAPDAEFEGEILLELEPDVDERPDDVVIDTGEDRVDVENPEEADVAESVLMAGNEVESTPMVTVERTPVSSDALEAEREEAMGMEDVADASGEEKEPVMLLRLKKGE
jgi:hypothetical protein